MQNIAYTYPKKTMALPVTIRGLTSLKTIKPRLVANQNMTQLGLNTHPGTFNVDDVVYSKSQRDALGAVTKIMRNQYTKEIIEVQVDFVNSPKPTWHDPSDLAVF